MLYHDLCMLFDLLIKNTDGILIFAIVVQCSGTLGYNVNALIQSIETGLSRN